MPTKQVRLCLCIIISSVIGNFYARQRRPSYSAYMPWQFRLSVCHTGGSVKNG